METKKVNSFRAKAKTQLEYLAPESLEAYYKLKINVIKYHAIFSNLGEEAQEAIEEIQKNTDINSKQNAYNHYKDRFLELFNLQEKVNNYTENDYIIRNSSVDAEKIKDFYLFKPKLIFGLNNSINSVKQEIEQLKGSDSINNTSTAIKELKPKSKSKRAAKPFPEYLLLKPELREPLAEALREEFKIEKGKGIRLMIEGLKEMELLTYDEVTSFYEALKLYFKRDIASKQAIFDKLDKNRDIKEFEGTKKRLNLIKQSIVK